MKRESFWIIMNHTIVMDLEIAVSHCAGQSVKCNLGHVHTQFHLHSYLNVGLSWCHALLSKRHKLMKRKSWILFNFLMYLRNVKAEFLLFTLRNCISCSQNNFPELSNPVCGYYKALCPGGLLWSYSFVQTHPCHHNHTKWFNIDHILSEALLSLWAFVYHFYLLKLAADLSVVKPLNGCYQSSSRQWDGLVPVGQ